MAKVKFTGQVRGYSIDDAGKVHLSVDDTEVSEAARFYVRDLDRAFNPQSNLHGYGAKDVPCGIRPGMASYFFVVPEDKCKGISFGSLVEVEIDLFNVRKVKFYNKRWAAIAELRTELVSVRAVPGSKSGAKHDMVEQGK